MRFGSGINTEVFQIVSIGLIVVAVLIFILFLVSRYRKKKASNKTEGSELEKEVPPSEQRQSESQQLTELNAQLLLKTREIARLQANCERLEKELIKVKNQQRGQIARAKSYALSDESKRILVVEDNETILKEAVEMLQKMDYKTETASNGYAALQLIREHDPRYYDLILMDAIMTEMDGYETALKIRAMDRSDMKHIPIIAMSANPFEREINLAKEAKIDDMVSKPLNARQIERVLRQNLPFNAETFNYII